MARLPADVTSKTFVRTDVSAGEAEQQRVVKLTHGRLSHGVEHGDVYLLMRKGTLHRIEPAGKNKSAAQIITSDGPVILEAVQRVSQSGVKVSAAALEADAGLVDALGGRARMRTALELLIENGHNETTGKARATRYTVTDQVPETAMQPLTEFG